VNSYIVHETLLTRVDITAVVTGLVVVAWYAHQYGRRLGRDWIRQRRQRKIRLLDKRINLCFLVMGGTFGSMLKDRKKDSFEHEQPK